ncbi:MAG: potassium channel family protein [Lachnospiraceae bacterium]
MKKFGVFGLGDFGRSVAIALAKNGCDVLAVDIHEENIQDIADYVSMAVRADLCDQDALKNLNIKSLDVVVVAVGDNMEAGVMATIMAKEAGVPYILAKAKNEIYAKVLRKVGADEIVFPEVAMGQRIAKGIMTGKFIDLLELSSKFSITEFKVFDSWIGKTFRELNLRERYGVNMIARKVGEEIEMDLDPDTPLEKGAIYIVAGSNQSLEKCLEEETASENQNRQSHMTDGDGK